MPTPVAPVIEGLRLVYTTDRQPGYRRVRSGRGFRYLLPDGSALRQAEELKRIKSLAIPPAYREVWICRKPSGHLQATGFDVRGRKQYRYHPLWHQYAGDRKFSSLPAFAASLPAIRAAAKRDLNSDELSRARVIAGVIALLDATGFRIGNRRYAKQNRSYGLSSLLSRHLKEQDGEIHFAFVGKAGLPHDLKVDSPSLIRLVHDLQDLPGQYLFRFEGSDGKWHDLETSDINGWLKEVGGGDFTAKQFRTWRATLECACLLGKVEVPESKSAKEKEIRTAIRATAEMLRHTVTTCRKFYIHPAIPALFKSGVLGRVMNSPPPRSAAFRGLRADEKKVLSLIRKATLVPAGQS